MNAIEQAIANAAAAQQAAAGAVGTAVSTVQNTGTAVATAPLAKGPALTMETVSTGSISVDAWLKPKEFGLLVGDNATLFDAIKVSIDMTEHKGFVVKLGIKAGNPAQYAYSTDGVTAVNGGSWEQACAKMRALDSKASEYRCVDLPFTLLEDLKDKAGKVIAEAGKKLGYTTSTTNWKAWEAFYRECFNAGLMGKVVELTIGAERRVNKAGNIWGTMTFANPVQAAEEVDAD